MSANLHPDLLDHEKDQRDLLPTQPCDLTDLPPIEDKSIESLLIKFHELQLNNEDDDSKLKFIFRIVHLIHLSLSENNRPLALEYYSFLQECYRQILIGLEQTPHQYSPMVWAAACGFLFELKKLWSQENLAMVEKTWNEAVDNGHINIVEFLLSEQASAPIDIFNNAVIMGRRDMYRLLKARLGPEYHQTLLRDPLSAAIQYHRQYFFDDILAGQPSLTKIFNSRGQTPLQVAATYQALAYVEPLIRFGVDINETDQGQDRNTALHEACLKDDLEMVVLLLKQAQINCRIKNAKGETPLQIAVAHKRKDISDAILKCDPSAKEDLEQPNHKIMIPVPERKPYSIPFSEAREYPEFLQWIINHFSRSTIIDKEKAHAKALLIQTMMHKLILVEGETYAELLNKNIKLTEADFNANQLALLNKAQITIPQTNTLGNALQWQRHRASKGMTQSTEKFLTTGFAIPTRDKLIQVLTITLQRLVQAHQAKPTPRLSQKLEECQQALTLIRGQSKGATLIDLCSMKTGHMDRTVLDCLKTHRGWGPKFFSPRSYRDFKKLLLPAEIRELNSIEPHDRFVNFKQ